METSSCSCRSLPIIFSTMYTLPRLRYRLSAIAVTLMFVAVALCGCGGGDSSPTGGNNPPPGSETNRVRLDCPVTFTSPTADTTIALDVYLTSDQSIAGFTLGFHYSSNDVEIVDVRPGPALDSDTTFFTSAHPESNLFLVLWANFTPATPLPVLDNQKAFSLIFSVPAGTPPQSIDVDSAFVGNSGRFLFAFENGEASPGYDDCGSADIVIEAAPSGVIARPRTIHE